VRVGHVGLQFGPTTGIQIGRHGFQGRQGLPDLIERKPAAVVVPQDFVEALQFGKMVAAVVNVVRHVCHGYC